MRLTNDGVLFPARRVRTEGSEEEEELKGINNTRGELLSPG